MAKHPAKCPKCGGRLDYESAAGDFLVCPGCQARLRLPGRPQQAALPKDPLIGQSLGEFVVESLLGRGGMGAVYRGRQPSLGRAVAIKVLPEHYADDPAFIERFHREARAAAAINHPNITAVYAIGNDKGHEFIAMELVEGETLAGLLAREGRLAPDRAVELLSQVASALAEAHAAGVVHRDIKPANILIDARGRAKVADFGLAKRADSDVSVTATGASLGTPLYMPPEIAEGKPADARSDLYSLGATFYQALAGRPPFEGATHAELILKHVRDAPPPLHQLVPDAPIALCRTIHRLLYKNPAERYESAEKLLEALGRVESRLGGGASVPRVPSRDGDIPPARGADATRTLAPDHVAPRPVPHRAAARGGSRSRVILFGGIAAAVLLVLLVLALRGKSTPRPSSSALPSAPTANTKHPTPDPSVLEQHAALCLEYAQTCAKRGDWPKTREYLDALASKYAATRFATGNKSAIATLRAQAEAALNPASQPKIQPKAGPAAEWTTLPNGWRVGKPVNLGPVVNSAKPEASPFLSADGLTLLFSSERPGGHGGMDMWVSSRRSAVEPWGEPVNLGPTVNRTNHDNSPRLASDGLTLWFSSWEREGGRGRSDLWVCTRPAPADPWGPPENAGPTLNSEEDDATPFLSADGLTLFFASDRQGGQGGLDLWMSTRRSARHPWGKPVNLGAPVNTTAQETSPCLSSDGLTLFFDSNGGGGRHWDLWMSTRRSPTEPFGEPVNLGPTVNSAAYDNGPALSPDGRTLYFQSNRSGGQGRDDLWQAPLLPPGAPVPAPQVADDEARWGPWEELFDGKTLDGWQVLTEPYPPGAPKPGPDVVTASDGQLLVNATGGRAGVRCTSEFPKSDYELEFESQRIEGERSLGSVVFPVGETAFGLVVGEFERALVGLELIDGKHGGANLTTVRVPFEDRRWYRVGLRVTRPRIAVFVDGKRVIDFATAGHDIRVSQWMAPYGPFGINTFLTRVALRNIRLRRLKSEGAHAPLPAPDAQGWMNLLDAKCLEAWQAVEVFPGPAVEGKPGTIRAEKGQLILERGEGWTGARWGGEFPTTNYEVEVEAQRMAGYGEFCNMALRAGMAYPFLKVGSFLQGGGHAVAFEQVDSKPARENATTTEVPLPSGQWHAVRVRVAGGRIEVSVNGRKVIELDDAARRLPGAAPPDSLWPFGICGWRVQTAIRSVRLRHLKPEAPPPDDDARWGPWEELFDGKTLKGWEHAGGRAFVQDGALVSENGADLFYAAKWTDLALECEVQGTSGPVPHCAGLQLGHEGLGRGAPHRMRLLFSRHDDLVVEADGTRLWKATTGQFPVGNWLRLRLEMTRDKLAIHREGKLVQEIHISALPVRAGGVYFYSYAGGSARLRNIRVRPLEAGGAEAPKAGAWKVYTGWPFDEKEAKRRQEETAKALGVPVE